MDIANEHGLVDDAGRGFAADVKTIVGSYHEEEEKAAAAKAAAVAKAEKIINDAKAKHEAAIDEARRQCAARIRQAADIRADKSEHPEDIHAVCNRYLSPFDNGNSGTLDPSCVLEWLEQTRQAIIDSEKENERLRMLNTRQQGTIKAGSMVLTDRFRIG